MRYSTKPLADLPWVGCTFCVAGGVAAVAVEGDLWVALGSIVLLLVLGPMAIRAAKPRTAVHLDGVADFCIEVKRDSRRMWVPLWIALGWLLGTYAAFWTTGLSARVTNQSTLTSFIAATTTSFALGYFLFVKRQKNTISLDSDVWNGLRRGRILILIAAIYMAIFGLLQLSEYGATSVSSVLARIQDPGSAYQAKFGVYAIQQATSRVSVPMQIVTLSGALYGVLCPMLIIYWRKLHLAVRSIGILGLFIYATYFLFIGTQKGLGDIVVMLLAGSLAGAFGTWWTRVPRQEDRHKILRYSTIVILVFLIYVVSAQAQRAKQFGTQNVTPPNKTVASLIGSNAATGVSAALFYPTHGYLGLSYNLATPFEWTKGLGASPVVASYASQYLKSASPATYPLRTEYRTGWPAGQYWATIYPWLASDLTFPGVALFMIVFGWLFAKMWVEGAMKRDPLALVIFGQLAIAVAYIPANNQLGVSRPTTIGLITLLALYIARSFQARDPDGARHV